MSKSKTMCEGCDCKRRAIYQVLVPWTDRDGNKGATWEATCRRCYPTGERWQTRAMPEAPKLTPAQFNRAVARMLDRADDWRETPISGRLPDGTPYDM